jgi:5-methylcytosine-specific restriction endonuclease McrA
VAFPQEVKDKAFARSGGQCECVRQGHGHPRRCPKVLTRATAQFHHRHAEALGGSDALSNCEVLCLACHQATPSYGRH